jgi:hypothetical protein
LLKVQQKMLALARHVGVILGLRTLYIATVH